MTATENAVTALDIEYGSGRSTHDRVADPLRPEIALSWRRSRVSGLDPGAPNMRFEADAVRRRTRMLAAAAPVLARLADELSDTPYCVLLADREARIAEDPAGSAVLRKRLAGIGVIAGGVFLEETTGTNSLATAHELRHGVVVHGDEHYLEPFKAFSCYGHPVIHPVTHRLEGVLDITCLSENASPLLKPLVAQAVRDIESNLLEIGRRTERRLLAEFQIATSGHDRPVVGLAAGAVLANRAATELLAPADHLRLGELAAELTVRRGRRVIERTETITLATGSTIIARMRVVEPGLDAVLVELAPEALGAQSNRMASVGGELVAGRPVYVGGAPGTGRSSTARALTGDGPVVVLDGAGDDRAWSALPRMLAVERASVLIAENIHLLPESRAVQLHRILESTQVRAVLTGPAPDNLSCYPAILAASCATHIELRDLAERPAEIPDLVHGILDKLGLAGHVRFTAAALAALAQQPWPGNLRELETVVGTAVEHRSVGDIVPSDLPERYRIGQRRSLNPLERAEFDAIVGTLRACGGNKQRAAQQLGISRTTLYNRMRTLRIPG
ncbi:sigma-54-dependent Fis family transcriptional regulator [Nocardia sp. NPDC050630]|uniref:sigma-54-dependent Fis family transcriptional regulator n=1 Tax=Nocardia sp. NPDC050630 TaxID=3364321 RepID=UPI0037B19545